MCLFLVMILPGLRIRIYFIRIRIRHFKLNTDPDPDPIPIQGFNDQKLKKKLQLKKKQKKVFELKTILHIPRPPLRTSSLHKKTSALKRGHPTL
jgi:hypothetical protein